MMRWFFVGDTTEGGGADGSFHSFVQVEQCVEERESERESERERERERGEKSKDKREGERRRERRRNKGRRGRKNRCNSFIPTHPSMFISLLFSSILFSSLLFYSLFLSPRYPPLAVRRAPSWGWILENEYVWFFSSSEACKAFFVEFNAAAP